MPDHQLNAVLTRFPGPVRLAPSHGKWVLVLLGCIGFTAAGAVMIRAGDATGWLASLIALGIPVCCCPAPAA